MKASDLSTVHYFKSLQTYQTPASAIASIGVEIPDNYVDNKALIKMLNAPASVKKALPTIIRRATKCKTRVYSPPGTSPSDLAISAAWNAFDRCDIDPSDIDTLIFASTDMDTLEPATANIVQKKMNLNIINAFDVRNACNSFLQAMNVANSFIISGAAKNVLIVCGEIGSYVVNREIKTTQELSTKLGGLTLGDAGAAMIMTRSDGTSGLLEVNLLSMGEHWEMCHVPETTDWRKNGNGKGIHGWFYLDMPKLAKVAKAATENYFRQYQQLRKTVYGENAIFNHLDMLIPHQISRKFIENIAAALDYDLEKIHIVADVLGNTASTSIPLVLSALIDDGTLAYGSGKEAFLYGAASGFSIGHLRIRL